MEARSHLAEAGKKWDYFIGNPIVKHSLCASTVAGGRLSFHRLWGCAWTASEKTLLRYCH